MAKHSLRNKKLGITYSFQIEYKADTELTLSQQNCSSLIANLGYID